MNNRGLAMHKKIIRSTFLIMGKEEELHPKGFHFLLSYQKQVHPIGSARSPNPCLLSSLVQLYCMDNPSKTQPCQIQVPWSGSSSISCGISHESFLSNHASCYSKSITQEQTSITKTLTFITLQISELNYQQFTEQLTVDPERNKCTVQQTTI
ncbi:hypothetical protein V8G54_012109 [Vigna mungo]|uniref:Uncharacterized protein n=1 Tax=Vigna mungo TaxID=3915 RepID=A0AAQ3NU40_VIGMU